MTSDNAASSSSSSHRPPPPPLPATSLAPGFRFHPTDEELVSYYLKRKVLARPFRVDAISDVDLYKTVPWDLPGMSRIQSRDREWYFFSPLDRKYTNRSRTNRATGHGYWKTTGKDRPVRRGPRVVGMKKTLVYHVGRAPRGERTNWVMHEYRLEDEELARAGVAQDEYVVCRIFQKSGAGPQNGAQYGAPFVEEEWENDDDMLLPSVDGVEQQFSAPGCCQQSTQADDDFAQESKDVLILNGNDGQLAVPDDGIKSLSSVAFDNGQNIFDHPVVPNEVHENQESIDTMDQNIDLCWLNDEERFGMDQNYGLQELHQDQGFPEDDYLELKDLTDSPHGGHSCVQYPSNQLPGIRNVQVSTRFNQVTNLPELHGVEEFFNSTNGNADLQEPIGAFSPFETNIDLGMNEMLNPVMGDYPSGEQADDGRVYYDAPSRNLAADHGGFIEMNDFLYPMISGSSTSDPVDELMAYFDATDNHLQLSYLENPERADSSSLDQTQSVPEVVEGNALPQASGASIEKGASSTTPLVGDETTIRNNDFPVAQGVQSRKDWDKSITGRLVGMLGSMPAPPALAAEHPMKGAKPLNFSTSACSSTSVHITAGMIHIDGLTVTESGKHWSVHKSQDVDFLLSYGMARSHFGSNTEKMHGGVISLVIRSGFRLLFLSILFLALSFKMAICIYSR